MGWQRNNRAMITHVLVEGLNKMVKEIFGHVHRGCDRTCKARAKKKKELQILFYKKEGKKINGK